MSDSNYVHHRPFDLLYYSLVDMDANAGKGKVYSKNNLLQKDSSISPYGLTATRHANGRDLWLIIPGFPQNAYYVYLVTPDTVTGPVYQLIQPGNYGNVTPDGQGVFSQDGSKMGAINFGGE
ncbi:MAG: hypothetical protein NTY88_13745 [Bacteroidetes bacterium]|nr:hypothetical protein [Bacteroidota bacterium]